jgi:hypothetical protein
MYPGWGTVSGVKVDGGRILGASASVLVSSVNPINHNHMILDGLMLERERERGTVDGASFILAENMFD